LGVRMSTESYFATCATGLEPLVAGELAAINATKIELGRGGVSFTGDRSTLYLSNLWLRTAVRVLMPIMQVHVGSPDDLYQAVGEIDWSQHLTPDHTLAVDCNVRDSAITHSKYAALRVKDAICDQFNERCGRRPSVDVETPMLGLNLHINRDEAVLSLDSSGDSLHKRGYRPIQSKAPLNEALAAALLQLSGWRTDEPLVDPMCGSGTLAIEAAWLALGRPPGLTRRRFGFQGWMDFDIQLWTQLRHEARRRVRSSLLASITGSDTHRDSLHFSQENARAAGVGHLLKFTQKDLADFAPPEGPAGVVICNPPYGERLGEERQLKGLYEMLGRVVKERCPGWRLCVFTGNAQLSREIDLPLEKEIRLFNGRIPCRLLCYEPT
jgi:putative N6-adenine-specific DNA methylase